MAKKDNLPAMTPAVRLLPEKARAGVGRLLEQRPELSWNEALFLSARRLGLTQRRAYEVAFPESRAHEDSRMVMGWKWERRIRERYGLTPRDVPVTDGLSSLADHVRVQVMTDPDASARDRLTAAEHADKAAGRWKLEVDVHAGILGQLEQGRILPDDVEEQEL